ncbi:3-phosphoserine/phosphohydroxythreonine transaminase [Bittarella sp. HCP28S3_D9]|uniref:3-phosphoserine/phosphohydroxythreonine transaminase n=1 Tax=Bittarella sp. HCP28S3_D9 TaxID=3440253 RepID=UPI003F8939D9
MATNRVYNFSAGPSMLPEWVLERASSEMLCYGSSGQSVMEMSHRSSAFEQIIGDCEASLRRALSIPEGYKVLFLQGGASSQFAMVPLNLLTRSGKADYVITGQWAKKAWQQGRVYGECRVVASSEDRTYSYIPQVDPAQLDPAADYLHICYNNTIYGTTFSPRTLPVSGSVPLVADMSSSILSEPVDISRFGLIYAGAQKNMGPAGLTVVIIREDLIGHAMEKTPIMFDYKTHAEAGSMYNTPPTYAIYICKLVLDWLQGPMGGLAQMAQRNREKAELLYDYLDQSRLFSPTVQGEDRSLMNVPFVTGDPALDAAFVKEAEQAGLVNLKGHRSVGGMRASIYNAMPIEGVEKLVAFMQAFESDHR